MTSHDLCGPAYDHNFLGQDHDRNARRVWAVIVLTATMMVAEIALGTVYGSMALVADGWHMATHAGAMLITALAYRFARRHAGDGRFSFGTGKVGDLAGFTSAVALGLIALGIGVESLLRLARPVAVQFDQAIIVAVVGLIVNLASAWMLRGDHDHHDHHHHHDEDHNLAAAYVHVLADALTSILAIVALVAGAWRGWLWPDAAMGIVGALVIARWSWGLMRDAGGVLLDRVPDHSALTERIRATVAEQGDEMADLHVWQLGPGHMAAILSVVTRDASRSVEDYRAWLRGLDGLSHLTIEVNRAQA
ncbi:MAG TPA: CDF family Co(II)/Ni(II) efflux transporter DmeF [Paenirhodobacter sp.]